MTITATEAGAMTSYFGHPEECLCTRCMMADMDATLRANGIDPNRYEVQQTEAERTRYAKPGTRAGRGVVRLVSDRQVNFIKRLLRERDTRKLVRLPGSEDIERMSLAGARDLIDRLLACPELPVTKAARSQVRMATEGQVNFIQSLVGRKGWGEREEVVLVKHGKPAITFAEAGDLIDYLKPLQAAPRKAANGQPVQLEDGIYRNPADGSIFKVYHTVHGANEQVAKRLVVLDEEERYSKTSRGKVVEVRAEFVYEGKKGLRDLTPEMKMTLDEAKEFGAIYGVCVSCGATLTREESIERAMGPVCASKF